MLRQGDSNSILRLMNFVFSSYVLRSNRKSVWDEIFVKWPNNSRKRSNKVAIWMYMASLIHLLRSMIVGVRLTIVKIEWYWYTHCDESWMILLMKLWENINYDIEPIVEWPSIMMLTHSLRIIVWWKMNQLSKNLNDDNHDIEMMP